MYRNPHPLRIRTDIDTWGVWYAIHKYGWRNLWSIFVATQVKQ